MHLLNAKLDLLIGLKFALIERGQEKNFSVKFFYYIYMGLDILFVNLRPLVLDFRYFQFAILLTDFLE